MAYRKVSDDSLTAIADAIRAKTGGTAAMAFPDGFVSAVASIEAGSGSGSAGMYDVTLSASDVTLEMYLISGEDGSISKVSAESMTVPQNSALALSASALGGTSSAAASIVVTVKGGSIIWLSSESSSSAKTLATAIFLVQINGDCTITVTRETGDTSA